MTEQNPTVAFTLDPAHYKKLEDKVKALNVTKSTYLRNMVVALLDAEERHTEYFKEEDNNVRNTPT